MFHFALWRKKVFSGLGFFEILVVLLMILLFFGSKELPHFIREGARLLGKVRRYSDKVRREIDEVTSIVPSSSGDAEQDDDVNIQKKKMREVFLEKRKKLTIDERKIKSDAIIELFCQTEEFHKAHVILVYASTKSEVQTDALIQKLFDMDKRVILPYCESGNTDMGIAEIIDISDDLVDGQYNIMEPRKELWDNFLKSDIQLAICPGVGFDKNGARLGRGKGCYDYFLKELKDKISLIGFAYSCQIHDDLIPFDYHDISMDMVITEDGIKTFAD